MDEIGVVSNLLPRLWTKPEEPRLFRLLVDEAKRWAAEIAERRYDRVGRPFEPSLLEYGPNSKEPQRPVESVVPLGPADNADPTSDPGEEVVTCCCKTGEVCHLAARDESE